MYAILYHASSKSGDFLIAEFLDDRLKPVVLKLINEFAATDDLDEHELADLHQKNDVRYIIDRYSDPTDMDDIKIVR